MPTTAPAQSKERTTHTPHTPRISRTLRIPEYYKANDIFSDLEVGKSETISGSLNLNRDRINNRFCVLNKRLEAQGLTKKIFTTKTVDDKGSFIVYRIS